MIPVCLSIAGSDPSAGAGIQADLKTFASLGCYGTTVITALTVQNTQGVRAIHAVDPNFVEQQLLAVLEDMPVKAVKIGMLGDSGSIEIISSILRKVTVPVVLDPVLISSSGTALLDEEGVQQLVDHLLPVCSLVTPNMREACQITRTPYGDKVSKQALANGLKDMGAKASLITGGDTPGSKKYDYLAISNKNGGLFEERFEQPAIDTKNSHGTGCTLSSAITSYLAMGNPLAVAVNKANAYVHQCLIKSKTFYTGKGVGGMNHFHAWKGTITEET